MKQELKENQGLPASLLWTLAIIAGISVANLYYNQPLLNRISRDLQTSEFTANLIAMITQIGYAIGLLFIIPLGDLFKRKTIILINFTVLVVSLLTIALTPYIHLILFASLLTGENENQRAGAVLGADKKGIRVVCGDGGVLCITEVQAPGKKRMKATDYLRGHPIL